MTKAGEGPEKKLGEEVLNIVAEGLQGGEPEGEGDRCYGYDALSYPRTHAPHP